MAITTGHSVICCDRNRRGGLKTIWLTNTDDITSFTAGSGATHEYTAVTMAGTPAGVFYNGNLIEERRVLRQVQQGKMGQQ